VFTPLQLALAAVRFEANRPFHRTVKNEIEFQNDALPQKIAVVVHTERGDDVRSLSERLASRRYRKCHAENFS